MAKSWLGWLTGKSGRGETRRAAVPAAAVEITPRDIDPVTGALLWERFHVMLEAERLHGPGVLLIVDLTARSRGAAEAAGLEGGDVLPWLAEAIRQAVRADDLLAHVEGYRFAVLLRGAPQEVGAEIGERILEAVDDTIFMTADGIINLVGTVGGTVYQRPSDTDILDAAISTLNIAKASGRALLIQ